MAGELSAGVTRTFASLRSYNYRLYWSGQLVSLVGTWMQRMGQAWLVLDLSGSPAALGQVTALQFLPLLCFSLFGGVIVDRLPKRRLMIATQSAALVQALVLTALVASGAIRLWEIYLLALVLGLTNALDNPARQAFVVELVGREQVANAIGLNSAVMNSARLVGPALAGLVIARWGVGVCFALNAVSFLAVLIGLLLMDEGRMYAQPTRLRGRVLSQIGEGVRYVLHTPEAVFVIIAVGGLSTFGYNFNIVIPILARTGLHVGATGFGLMMSSLGVGSLCGALWAASRGRADRRLMMTGAVAFAALFLAVAGSSWFGLTLALLAPLGFASLVFSTSSNTLLQLLAPDDLRGRVMSFYTLMMAGTTPIGSLVTGYLASSLGVRTAIGIEALLCGFAVACALVYAWRRLEPRAASSF